MSNLLFSSLKLGRGAVLSRGFSGSVTAASGGVVKLAGTIFLRGLLRTLAGCAVTKEIGDAGLSGGGGGNGGDWGMGGDVRKGGCGDCYWLWVRSASEFHGEGGQFPNSSSSGRSPQPAPSSEGRVGWKIHAMAGKRNLRTRTKPTFNYLRLLKTA